jgi:hypothetical protein
MYVERSLRSAHRYLRRPRLKLGGRPYNSPPSGGTGPGTSTSTAAQLSLRPSSRPEGSWAGGRAQSKGQARRLATAPLKGQSSSPCPAVARNSASLPERAGLGARSTPACGGLVPFTHHTVLSILSACKFRHVRGPSPHPERRSRRRDSRHSSQTTFDWSVDCRLWHGNAWNLGVRRAAAFLRGKLDSIRSISRRNCPPWAQQGRRPPGGHRSAHQHGLSDNNGWVLSPSRSVRYKSAKGRLLGQHGPQAPRRRNLSSRPP